MPATLVRRVHLLPQTRGRSRGQIERLLVLAEHLRDEDRLLFEQVYRGHLTLVGAARLSGAEPRALARRLRRILRRLRHPLFAFLAGNKDWIDPDIVPTAQRVIFQRRSLRRAAALTGRSLHQVRQDMRALRTLAGV